MKSALLAKSLAPVLAVTQERRHSSLVVAKGRMKIQWLDKKTSIVLEGGCDLRSFPDRTTTRMVGVVMLVAHWA
jgi:hypothetical protein